MTVILIHLSINISPETDIEDDDTMHKKSTPDRNFQNLLPQNIFRAMLHM